MFDEFTDVFFDQSAILGFLHFFGFSLKKNLVEKVYIHNQQIDGIIEVYIIDGVERLN